jgi:RNA polymerase sigma factor (sigma-70 family)
MMQRIADVYELHEKLGQGGMGEVFRATDARTQQTVAIKQLKAHIAQPDLIERFKREGEALRALNHPNIVQMLDTVEEHGNHYLVMEYVAGGDLAALLKQGQMPLENILKLAIDLADALTRAHKLNIIHRDLKPANVLIGADNVLRLTDFGVAHVGSKARVTDTDAIVGTLDYLPPEAFSGGTLDARGDIWGFGVMLFEMLAGQRPFEGEQLAVVVHAILTEPVPDLEALRPDVPTALIDLIYRMLEKDPQARIPSVRVIGAELEAILEGRAVSLLLVQKGRFDAPQLWLNPPRHNLPAQTTPFVGREQELHQIARYFANPDLRLLTIVGQGGMGKTRLMLEVAQRLMSPNDLLEEPPPFYDDGVFLVELAPLTTPDDIVTAAAAAVGCQLQSDGRSPRQQLLDFLRPKRLGLLMDNFEHVLAGADFVADMLQAAPHVRITTTSRERLNISGEVVFHLEGMDFPDWETPTDALEYSAVKLFMQGATRALPAFELKTADLPYVARICKLAQGMPLAIILAASWVALLSLREIADEMTKNIDFLESAARDLPERQRSMRAVFEYSWNLMSAAEQQVFMKLAIFRGGFTREAAEAVAGATLRLLMSLANKSLIRRHAETGRYEIHELLRQYGEDRLEASGEATATRDAHSAYYAGFIHVYEPAMRGGSPRGIQILEATRTALHTQFTITRTEAYRLEQLLDPLTEREIEILRLVAAGLSNDEIAQKLVISVSTVKTHLTRIFDKLNVKSRTQAILQAQALHLLP